MFIKCINAYASNYTAHNAIIKPSYPPLQQYKHINIYIIIHSPPPSKPPNKLLILPKPTQPLQQERGHNHKPKHSQHLQIRLEWYSLIFKIKHLC